MLSLTIYRQCTSANKYYEQIGSQCVEIDAPFEIPLSWQWCRISNVSILIGNKSNQIQAKDILQSGLIPVVSQGKEVIEGFSNDTSRVIDDVPIVLFGDHTKNVKYIDFPFVIGADGTKIHKPIKIHPKYLYYWMLITSYNLRDRGYARHYSILCDNYISLPPLNEQHRIVEKIEKLVDF